MTPSDNLIASESAPIDQEALRAELNVIYGTYRQSAMNQKYYANRLTHLTRLNRTYEILLALGTSTAIAGWAFWTFNYWTRISWAVFSAVISLLATIKPFLKLPEDIEKYSTLHTGYRALYVNLESIVSKIKRRSLLTSEVRELFDAAQDQYKSLALNAAVNINRKILNEMQEQVNQEITVESLWYPSRQTISQIEAVNMEAQ